MDCCIHTQGMDAYFSDRKAQREVSHYLKHGLASHAGAMLEAVSHRDVQGANILEVGGGIGSLQIELLRRGASQTINVEASAAYMAAAQRLAGQLGLAERMRSLRADFAFEADLVSTADIVILHRVVCCYPDMRRLVSAAAGHTRRVLALSFPREAWYVRLYIEAQAKWMQVKGSHFRNYVHSPAAIRQVAAEAELRPVHESFSGTWQIIIFEH